MYLEIPLFCVGFRFVLLKFFIIDLLHHDDAALRISRVPGLLRVLFCDVSICRMVKQIPDVPGFLPFRCAIL